MFFPILFGREVLGRKPFFKFAYFKCTKKCKKKKNTHTHPHLHATQTKPGPLSRDCIFPLSFFSSGDRGPTLAEGPHFGSRTPHGFAEEDLGMHVKGTAVLIQLGKYV